MACNFIGWISAFIKILLSPTICLLIFHLNISADKEYLKCSLGKLCQRLYWQYQKQQWKTQCSLNCAGNYSKWQRRLTLWAEFFKSIMHEHQDDFLPLLPECHDLASQWFITKWIILSESFDEEIIAPITLHRRETAESLGSSFI